MKNKMKNSKKEALTSFLISYCSYGLKAQTTFICLMKNFPCKSLMIALKKMSMKKKGSSRQPPSNVLDKMDSCKTELNLFTSKKLAFHRAFSNTNSCATIYPLTDVIHPERTIIHSENLRTSHAAFIPRSRFTNI